MGVDGFMDELRGRVHRLIGDNATAMYAPGAAASGPTPPARQWWNLPAKYEAARRIKEEMLAGYPGHNDAGDALRHSELSRRMAAEIDPATSAVAGFAHELENSLPAPPAGLVSGALGDHIAKNWHGQRWPERRMDLHNNAEGIRAALEGRPVDPRNLQERPVLPTPDLRPYGGARTVP